MSGRGRRRRVTSALRRRCCRRRRRAGCRRSSGASVVGERPAGAERAAVKGVVGRRRQRRRERWWDHQVSRGLGCRRDHALMAWGGVGQRPRQVICEANLTQEIGAVDETWAIEMEERVWGLRCL